MGRWNGGWWCVGFAPEATCPEDGGADDGVGVGVGDGVVCGVRDGFDVHPDVEAHGTDVVFWDEGVVH